MSRTRHHRDRRRIGWDDMYYDELDRTASWLLRRRRGEGLWAGELEYRDTYGDGVRGRLDYTCQSAVTGALEDARFVRGRGGSVKRWVKWYARGGLAAEEAGQHIAGAPIGGRGRAAGIAIMSRVQAVREAVRIRTSGGGGIWVLSEEEARALLKRLHGGEPPGGSRKKCEFDGDEVAGGYPSAA